MKSQNKYIGVDFDGTIVKHRFPEIGDPVPLAITVLRELQKSGVKIILFTMRSDGQKSGNVLTEAVEYIEKHGISLYGINHNPDQDSWTTSPKAYAHAYVDDLSVGCPLIHPSDGTPPFVDWGQVWPELERIFELS